MLGYVNIFLPKNLESFIKSLNIYSMNYLPNIGHNSQYSGYLSTKDQKITPNYFGKII